MTSISKDQVFRLAAVLYADNNYDVKTGTIHKKIIESILLECKKKECTLHEILDYASDKYGITLEEEQVKKIVTSEKTNFLYHYNKDECFISLDEKRRQTLDSKISNKTIEYFISQFEIEFTNLPKSFNVKNTIYRFIYEIFSTNTASFQKLVKSKIEITGLFNSKSTSYTVEEKEIINNFLHWDNPDKNKAIFDISSYSLEYCMLTNNNGSSSIHLQNLKNKSFFLDTNVIYRALGINGDDRKKRSRTFLQKFCDSGENLLLTILAENEFKEGVKSKIDRIRRYDSPRISSKVYQGVKINPEIYSYYHQWRIGKVNTSLDLFAAYLFSEYEQFKKDFKIKVEYTTPYDSEDKEIIKTIGDYSSKIQTFKSDENTPVVGSSYIDAENIVWIEKKRNGNVNNLFDTKFFFISTDQALRKWDYQRSNNTPIVLLPSQWMSILLRYLDCTANDYKSFVSFLNLKSNEVLINNEKLHIVLAGISEITDSIEQQRLIINTLIENKFNGIIEKSSSDETIFENSKQYAESELESQVKDLSRENRKLSDKHRKLSSKIEGVTLEVEILKEAKSDKSSELDAKIDENKKLKTKLIELEITNAFSKWQKGCIPWGIAALIISIYILSFFIAIDSPINFSQKLCNWKDSLTNDFTKMLATALMYSPLLGLWLIIKSVLWKRLVSTEKKHNKLKDIREETEQKHNY